MSLADGAFFGMLGCLALGYALGRLSRRKETEDWKRAAMRWHGWYRLTTDQLERMAAKWFAGDETFNRSQADLDAEAVERLIRETKP